MKRGDTITKVCVRCGVKQPLENFYSNSKSKDGLRYRCKDCCKDDNYRELIVLRTCVDCGKFILPPTRLHCKECSKKLHSSRVSTAKHNPTKYNKHKNKPKRLPTDVTERYNEIRKITRKYIRNNFRKLANDQKVESLGTFATAQVFRKDKDCGIRKKKDGTIDCIKERKDVNLLKHKTYVNRKRQYSGTEGDFIRNTPDIKELMKIGARNV